MSVKYHGLRPCCETLSYYHRPARMYRYVQNMNTRELKRVKFSGADDPPGPGTGCMWVSKGLG